MMTQKRNLFSLLVWLLLLVLFTGCSTQHVIIDFSKEAQRRSVLLEYQKLGVVFPSQPVIALSLPTKMTKHLSLASARSSQPFHDGPLVMVFSSAQPWVNLILGAQTVATQSHKVNIRAFNAMRGGGLVAQTKLELTCDELSLCSRLVVLKSSAEGIRRVEVEYDKQGVEVIDRLRFPNIGPSFAVDGVPPSITINTPESSTEIHAPGLRLPFDITIREQWLQHVIADIESEGTRTVVEVCGPQSQSCQDAYPSYRFTLQLPVFYGVNSVTVIAEDLMGNAAQRRRYIKIESSPVEQQQTVPISVAPNQDMTKKSVNPSVSPKPAPSGTNYKLLVLAPDSLLPTAGPIDRLIVHKNRFNMAAMVKSIESIEQDPAYDQGVDLPEKVKLAIANSKANYGIQYVLLIGDVDQFPVRYIKVWDRAAYGDRFRPSDLYYADLYDLPDSDSWDLDSGQFDNWDANGNRLFGEAGRKDGQELQSWNDLNPDLLDMKPDIAVGRLPVSNLSELERIVDRIIHFEKGTGQWRKRMLLVTGNFDNSNSIANQIADIVDDYDYDVTKYYHSEYWDIWPVEERPIYLNRTMQSGYGFVAYLGHGSGGHAGIIDRSVGEWSGWYKFSDIAALDNQNKWPVILAGACDTAKFHFFDYPYLDSEGNYYTCPTEFDDLFIKDASFKQQFDNNHIDFQLRGFKASGADDYDFSQYSIQSESGVLKLKEGDGLRFKMIAPAISANSLLEYWRSLRSYNYPDRYIRHQYYGGELTPIVSELDQSDATFRMVPGLAIDNYGDTYEYISFESWNYPGWYLTEQDGRLLLLQRPSCVLEFDKRATFKRVGGLYGGGGSSFESFVHPGLYIRHRNFHLYVESGTDELFRQDATFIMSAPKQDPRPYYHSLQHTGSSDLMLYRRDIDGNLAAVLDTPQTIEEQAAATFRLLPALAKPGDNQYISLEPLFSEPSRLRSQAYRYIRHQYALIKVSERRPMHLRDAPEPASIQLQPLGNDVDSLAENFLGKNEGGAVAYIGSNTGVQPISLKIVRYVFEEFAEEPAGAVLGDLWNRTVNRVINEDFDGIEDNWGYWWAPAPYDHLHKMMLFGDPSLRVGVPRDPQALEVVGGEHDFGDVRVSDTATHVVYLSNSGGAVLALNDLTVSGEGYTLDVQGGTHPCGDVAVSIAPGDHCTVAILFSPSALQYYQGDFTLHSDDLDRSSLSYNLSGAGTDTDPQIIRVTPSSYNFGEITIGGSAAITIIIANDGTAELILHDMRISGAGFSLDLNSAPNPCHQAPVTLNPSEQCAVRILFAPSTPGSYSGQFRVVSNDADTPDAGTNLYGSGTSGTPDIVAGPESCEFIVGPGGRTFPCFVSIQNAGNANLYIGIAPIASLDFNWRPGGLQPCPDSHPTLMAGEMCSIVVYLQPQGSGEKNDVLILQSNDPDSPEVRIELHAIVP